MVSFLCSSYSYVDGRNSLLQACSTANQLPQPLLTHTLMRIMRHPRPQPLMTVMTLRLVAGRVLGAPLPVAMVTSRTSEVLPSEDVLHLPGALLMHQLSVTVVHVSCCLSILMDLSRRLLLLRCLEFSV